MTEPQTGLAGGYSGVMQRPETVWIILWNFIPMVGVLAFGWDALPLLVFYWIENVAIGALNVLKIIAAGIAKGRIGMLVTLFLVPFFCVHYGLFCYVHGVFVLAMLKFSTGTEADMHTGFDPFDVWGYVWQQLQTDADLRWSVLAMVAIQVVAFGVLWFWQGKWREANPMVQMFEPYGRVIVLHLTIFIATIPVLLLGQTALAVLGLCVVKCALELRAPLFDFGLDKIKDKWPPELSGR